MPGQTTRGYPYPLDNIDPPDGGFQMQALAETVDTDVGAIDAKTSVMPVGDDSNSVTLANDKLLTGSSETTILTKTFTVASDQYVFVNAKARIDNTGSATGGVGVYIAIDGIHEPLSHAGPINVGQSTGRAQVNTGTVSPFLTAGSHTITFQANRDGTGQMNAIASAGLSTGPTYHPTTMTIIV